jgi:beta-lactamase class A
MGPHVPPPQAAPSPLSPTPSTPSTEPLARRIAEIEERARPRALAVAMADLGSGTTFRYHADRWFHAASTIKVAILLGVYGAIHEGRLVAQSRVHVRNRFSSAWDGSPFRVASERDANSEVHQHIGSTMRVSELALHMIATSSNLATNLLLDLVGLETVQRALDELGIDGLDIRRGVEDEMAFERGINNRVTADGLVQLLRLIADGRAYSSEISQDMLRILHAQEFRNGIPARLPSAVRVAHKTGEISTIAHDAGVVYPPGRHPYVIAILTEWRPDAGGRNATIAEVSRQVYELLTAPAEPSDG